MKTDKDCKGVTYSDIIDRLKLSNSYIIHRITNNITHLEEDSAKGKRVYFDLNEIRNFFMNNATFTRQTKLVNVEREIREYKKNNPEKIFTVDEFIGGIPKLKSQKRSQLPEIPVNPFDFWDMALIFPKAYNKNILSTKSVNMEYCYRDMFGIGAVKIKLGSQKTIFCFVNDNRGVKSPNLSDYKDIDSVCRNKNYLLVPADWKPFYKIAG